MGFNAVRELFFGALGDFCCLLRLHHVAGTLLQKFFQTYTVNHVQRVNNVTLGLTHLLTFFIPNETCNVYGLERNLRFTVFILDEVHGHHNHSGNPEEDDVKTCYQYTGRVECF